MDLGYGFEIKTTKITGLIVIFGSLILTVVFYLIGKFIILGITWSFSFQVLSEIRHLIMDLGYGFEIKTTKVTGLIVIFGSVFLTIIFYLIGKNIF